MKQLDAAGGNIVAMCPICLVNLKHAAEEMGAGVADISELLVEAYDHIGIAQSSHAGRKVNQSEGEVVTHG
jgi:hypothetical protein